VRRSTRKTLALVASAAMLASVAVTGTAANAADPQELRFITAQQANTLDPDRIGYAALTMFTAQIYDSLTEISADGEAKPRLASGWKFNADKTSIDFTLRSDAKFADGSVISADDVVATMTRRFGAGLRFRANLVGVTTTKVSDNVVRFTNPNGVTNLPLTLGGGTGQIIQKKAIDAGTDISRQTAGIGMFRVESTTQDYSTIVLTKNPNYYDAKSVKLNKVTMQFGENSTRYLRVKAKQTDLTHLPGNLARLVNDPKNFKQTLGLNANSSIAVLVNQSRELMKDVRVRRAISMAIDRNLICQSVLDGACTPSTQAYPSASPYFDKSASTPYTTYNVNQARQLLLSAGAIGKTVVINTTTADAAYSKLAQIMKEQLEDLGLTVKINTFADPTQMVFGYLGFTGAANASDLVTAVIGPLSDPADIPAQWYLTTGTYNVGKVVNQPLIDAAKAGLGEETFAARVAQYRKVSAASADDIIQIPVMSENRLWTAGVKVQGFASPGFLGAFSLRNVYIGAPTVSGAKAIKCVKGKTTKVLVAKKCPAGYKLKK
jgi:peptide/nickel transport system substrate-binding protein